MMDHFNAHIVADTLASDMLTNKPNQDDLKRWKDWAKEVQDWCDTELANLQRVASLGDA